MRLFDKLVSLAVLAGLTSALRLDFERHIEIETVILNVTEYTAILNTTEFLLCFNNSDSYDLHFLNTSGNAAPTLGIIGPESPSSADYKLLHSCFAQQEIDDVGAYFSPYLYLEGDNDGYSVQAIDTEVITWRGVFNGLLSSHVEIVQPTQKSFLRTVLAYLSFWQDAW